MPPPGRVASLVAGLDHPQALIDYVVSALGAMLINYQKLNLPAFHALQKLPKEEMRKLVVSTLARVNIDEGEILSWIDKEKLEKLTTTPRTIPVPHPPVTVDTFKTHEYFIVGDSSLTLYKKGGAKVTLKSDLEWAWKGGNSCVYKSIGGGGMREIRDEILEYLRTHGNQGDVIVISYMMNDLFHLKNTRASGRVSEGNAQPHP